MFFGPWVRPITQIFAVAFVATLGIAGYLNHQGPVYFAVSVGGAIAMWVWRFSTLDLDVDEHCWSKHPWIVSFFSTPTDAVPPRRFQSQPKDWLGYLGRPFGRLPIKNGFRSIVVNVITYCGR